MQITAHQDETFRRDGVIELGRVLDESEAMHLADRVDRLLLSPVEDPNLQRRELAQKLDGTHKQSVVQIVNAYRVDESFRRLAFRSDLLDAARILLQGSVRILRDQIFYKPPSVGGKVFMHQDNRYWHLDPPSAITVWIALDDATKQNGCLHFLKGSHRGGRVEHVRALNGQSVLLEAVAAESDSVPIQVPRGYATAHDCQVLHWSAENKSPMPRRGYTIQYVAANAKQRGQPLDQFPIV